MLMIKQLRSGFTNCIFTTQPRNLLLNLLSTENELPIPIETEIYKEESFALSYFHGFYTLEIQANTIASVSDFNRFMRLIELERNHLIKFELQSISNSEKGVIYQRSRACTGKIIIYKLDNDEKISCLRFAVLNMAKNDTKLEKALVYYNHALFLLDQREKVIEKNDSSYLLAEAVLNFWKVVTLIIGEGKAWEEGLTNIGITDRKLINSTHKLLGLRNKKDVAHGTQEMETVDLLQPEIDEVMHTTKVIVESYIRKIDEKFC